MDGLNNIKLYPVRSLLTAKLAAMRQKHIQSALEVLHPVQDLSALSEKGYTTKGSGRGTGLSSYRKIISRYPGCVSRTYLRDGFFVQELHVPAV